MRIIASLKKSDAVRFVSHLDVQRVIHRTIARAKLPVSYSQGFNPHPLTSFATALSVGMTSDNEWFEVKLDEDITPKEFSLKMNEVFPTGFCINDCFVPDAKFPSLSAVMCSAEYTISARGADATSLCAMVETMRSGAILITKRKKQGKRVVEAEVDVSQDVMEMRVNPDGTLYVKGRLDATGGLPVSAFVQKISDTLGGGVDWRVHRNKINLADFF